VASSDADSRGASGSGVDSEGVDYAGLGDSFSGFAGEESREPAGGDLSRRLMSLLLGLLRVHVEIARREATRDQQRLVRGVVYLVVSGFVGLLSLLLLEGLALCGLLMRLRLPWALASLLGANLALSGLLLLLARRAFTPPVLPETRALLRRTLGSLLPK
jgi:hypothetical protein